MKKFFHIIILLQISLNGYFEREFNHKIHSILVLLKNSNEHKRNAEVFNQIFNYCSESKVKNEKDSIGFYAFKAEYLSRKTGDKNRLEKIKTNGDAYLAVCGLPIELPDHAQRVVRAAMDIKNYIEQNNSKFQIRIGIHSGPVVAGIVGIRKFAYDIWGDTVNTANRMESSSEGGKINISGASYALIKDEFNCTYRGKINVKNKGEIDMYFVNNI